MKMLRPNKALGLLLLTFGCSAIVDAETSANQGALVFGGSGRTGAIIVEMLRDQGEPVTVFVRPNSDRARLQGQQLAFAVGDATNSAEVDAAVAAARPRVIINALGGRGSQVGFWDRSQMAMTAAAKKYGVKRVVFLSSVGVGDSAVAYSKEALERTREAMAERFSAEEDLKVSGVEYVIIRTGIIAPEGAPATGKAILTEDRSVLSPVTRADLARLTVDCLTNPACSNKTFAAMDSTIKLSR